MMLNERRSPPTAAQLAVQEEARRWNESRWGKPIPTTRSVKCVLCGGPAERFTCAGCDETYRELGL